MPRQNRVDPFGRLIAVAARGTLMGNRGRLHDDEGNITRRWTTRAWIACRLEFKGRHRQIMAPNRWTELFFLDEAIALSAGHRPCYYCRREAALAFADAWARAHRGARPRAAQIDAKLHEQRLQNGAKRIHPLRGSPRELPDGATIELSGDAYVIVKGMAYRWRECGYAAPRRLERADGLLTPPSTVAALRAGFRCVLHPSLSDVPDRRPASVCL
jgi:hypothetical protein